MRRDSLLKLKIDPAAEMALSCAYILAISGNGP
jgi:hypothetical protein